MKKVYVSDIVGLDYELWYYRKNKVFLDAPMGLGKTTFVTDTLLGYIRKKRNMNPRHNDKMLILNNRTLLGMQYGWDLLEIKSTYQQLQDIVEVKSYQEIAASIRNRINVDELFKDYTCIVCDEVHYFYADSDFNAFGTFAVLHAIIQAGISKMMLFMTATGDEIFPIIEEAIKFHFHSAKKVCPGLDDECGSIVYKNLQSYRNYDYVHPHLLMNDAELQHRVSRSEEKWLIFIDSRDRGQRLLETIRKSGKSAEIIHSDNIDKDSTWILELVMHGRLDRDVLITTSVLDNGVSIKDPLLKNVVIMTDSKISFIQMLGRVREEGHENLELYLVGRNANELKKRAQASLRLIEKFDRAKELDLHTSNFDIISKSWDDPYGEEGKDYRKIYILSAEEVGFIPKEYIRPYRKGNMVWKQKVTLYINKLAKEKTGDAYKTQSVLFKKAMSSQAELAYYQISWIGKEPHDLDVCEEDSFKQHEEKLINELEAFGTKTAQDVGKFKKRIATEYRDVISRHIKINRGSFEKDKLITLFNDYGFEVVTKNENGKVQYTTRRK